LKPTTKPHSPVTQPFPPETSKPLQNQVTSPYTVPEYLFPSTLKPYLGPSLTLLPISSSSSPIVLKIEKLRSKILCYFEFQLMDGARWTSSSQYISLDYNNLLSSYPKWATLVNPRQEIQTSAREVSYESHVLPSQNATECASHETS
jgi:hypothetical protein